MTNKIKLKSLLYKHVEYHQHVVEGIRDQEQIQNSFDWWASHSVITAITPAYPKYPKYIKVELPRTGNGPLVLQYADRAVSAGLWVCISDYGTDIEQFYWCRNWLTGLMRALLCRLIAEGPYLIHIVQIKKTRHKANITSQTGLYIFLLY